VCQRQRKSEINPLKRPACAGDCHGSWTEQLLALQITHCDDEHLIRLTSQEAALLVDACVMVILAAESVPQATLQPQLAALLASLFETLSPVVR